MRKHGTTGQFIHAAEVITIACETCATPITGPRYLLTATRPNGDRRLRRFCSIACSAQGQSKQCPHGANRFCRVCKMESEKRTRARYPGRYKKAARYYTIRKKYGLTAQEYDQLVLEQSGRCAIQDCAAQATHVDHDHATNLARGLLCAFHNRALGFYERDAARFAHYLANPPIRLVRPNPPSTATVLRA